MNITFNFKNFEPSDHLKNYARDRFSKLAKYMNNSDNADLQFNLSVEKFRQMAEVVISGDNLHVSAYDESEDMYSTIDLVLDKLDAQLRRMSEKKKDQRKRGGKKARAVRMDVIQFQELESGQRERTIVESDSYEPKPMSVEEAAMQLDSLNYEFLVFTNASTERTNVIYRRKNNDYGLIDPGL
jgi:putative sigma-54 modulation protein